MRIILWIICMVLMTSFSHANTDYFSETKLSLKEKSILSIASLTAKGDLTLLKPSLHEALDAGLTVNEAKEVLVHLYAYCGFPRSIRGLQTLMEVLEDRKARGIKDELGKDASPIHAENSKYERGKKNLSRLTLTPQPDNLSGYGAFAPVIDTFLKEHLFADIFERDVLTFQERQLVTIAVLSTIGNTEPMLRSHLTICLNVGHTPVKLREFVEIIRTTIGENEASFSHKILEEVLNNQ